MQGQRTGLRQDRSAQVQPQERMWTTDRAGKPVFSTVSSVPVATLGSSAEVVVGSELQDLKEHRPPKLSSPPPRVWWVEVQTSRTERAKYEGGSSIEYLVAFGLSVDKGGPCRVIWKRHSDFLLLHEALRKYYPEKVVGMKIYFVLQEKTQTQTQTPHRHG